MSADLFALAGGTVWCGADSPAPVRLAADELAGYLERITGTRPQRRDVAGDANAVWLRLSPPAGAAGIPPGAAGVIEAGGDALAIAGAQPRDALFAVYQVLEGAGCRWSPRGTAHEDVPTPATAQRTVESRAIRPAFSRRAYASDLTTWHYGVPSRLAARLPQDLAFVDWMAKTGATGWLFIRHAHDDLWLIPEVTDALRARGLAVEWGGHALVEWLPRAAFATHPAFFPMGPDGARTDFGNCCTSSREGLALIARGVQAARAATRADGLHLWGLDLFGGGWCHCDDCRALPPSDQALRLANAVADALPAPERVFHLAYHDTIHAPVRVRPHERVWAEFAPRERCYAHTIDATDCALNRRYMAALDGHLAAFDGRVDVFEYYGDAILFGGCAAPMVDVIARDLEAYHARGVRGLSCLTFGRFSHVAYGPNLEAFARGMHEPAAARGGHRHHAADVFGGAPAAEAYLAALEHAVTPLLHGGDVKLPRRTPAHRPAALAAYQASLERLAGVAAALARLDTASVRGAVERALLHYTTETVAGLRDALTDPVEACDAALARLHVAAAAFEETDEHVAHLGTWGAVDLRLTHSYFEGMLRAGSTMPAPFTDEE